MTKDSEVKIKSPRRSSRSYRLVPQVDYSSDDDRYFPTCDAMSRGSHNQSSGGPGFERRNEYTGLLPNNNNNNINTPSSTPRRSVLHKKYQTFPTETDDASGETSNTDDASSNSSRLSMSLMTRRQLLVFIIVMVSTLSSSLTVCLFPPFFPALSEKKGVSATGYGQILGANCLTAFLVTPIIGNHISRIGIKFAFVSGLIGGGVCCALSGTLEFYAPGATFVAHAAVLRVFQAIFNSLVITATFTYTACEFPASVAKIFSLTRVLMNVAQMFGPFVGGYILDKGGFYLPFLCMGSFQVIIALCSFVYLPTIDLSEDMDEVSHHRRKKGKASIFKLMLIPSIWFSFVAFIVATMCNGFLSVNLEPQVIRYFELTGTSVGILYGLRDGANSLTSPLWGWICDKQKKSVKPYLVMSCLLAASSFFIMKASKIVGFEFELTLPLLVLALCLNGMGIGGQQVIGVVDALHEAVGAGYPDDPTTQGLVAGLWTSFSGAGRFISRAGSGYLVDRFGFSIVSGIACFIQLLTGAVTFLYIVFCECHLVKRDSVRWDNVTIVDHNGSNGDDRVVFTQSSSPSETVMTRSVVIEIPRNAAGCRMVNSMPPKKWIHKCQRKRCASTRFF